MQTRLVLVMVALSPAGMAQGTRSERVVEALNQLCTAMLQENYDRAVDLTHPKVIQYFGGREKAIAAFEWEAESMKRRGVVLTPAKVGNPLGFWTDGSDLFTLEPTVAAARVRGGTLSFKADYIGVSSDQGKSWVFVPTGAFQDDKAKYLKEFFPNWPPLCNCHRESGQSSNPIELPKVHPRSSSAERADHMGYFCEQRWVTFRKRRSTETRGIRSANQSLNLEGWNAQARRSFEQIRGGSFVPQCKFPGRHLMGQLLSINVGLPRDVAWRGATVHTAIWKQPVQGRIAVRRLNVEGDGQGDLAGHGGEHRAVMVYQMDAYRYWEAELGRNDFSFGQFGENFTVAGLPDDEVSIGDRYRIGSALFEVTQPRVTCYRVGIRMAEPAMAALLVSHHRPGFYLRVLEEGEVGAGDEITKVADGPERITVADIDALLYLPNPSREQLERSLRVPALSQGWKTSLKAIAEQKTSQGGNPGLKTSSGPPPAWPGFRQLRVARVDREAVNVVSLSIEQTDGAPLPAALPGQFIVLRLRTTPTGPMLLRNYSMSGMPGAMTYRVSVKRETNGVVSSYLDDHVHAGDILEVSAPRGGFILRSGDARVILLSAGIGATPVLAMLHSLASAASRREIWWIYGARNRAEHPFAKESRGLLQTLVNSRRHIVYSKPDPEDKLGLDYDSAGHVDTPLLDRLGVARDADFYLCGPPSFLRDLTAGLKTWGADSTRIHAEVFGPETPITPGIAPSSHPPVHPPAGKPGAGPHISFTRSGLTVSWDSRFSSLLELAEACDVPVQWSCRTGVCHTCECALIGGTVQYQPDPLEPPAAGNVLICCSTPSGDVEIDL